MTHSDSLADIIGDHARHKPDAPAIISSHDTMTWASYDARSQRLARVLCSMGLRRGDRLAVMLPDGPGVHAAFVGCEKAGLTAVGIGPRAGLAELRHLLERTGARGILSRQRHRENDMKNWVAELRAGGLPLQHHIIVPGELEEHEAILTDGLDADESASDASLDSALEDRRLGPEDLFLLNSTSGTTGMPKCVRHDQNRWLHFHRLAVESGALSQQDTFFSAIPAPFGFGIWTAHVTPTLLGAPTVVLPSFSVENALEAIAAHRVTVLAAVSTQFIMILNSPHFPTADLASLRVLFTGGEAVPYERAVEFEERTGASVLQFYGSNETGALSRTTLADPREKRLRTAGRVIPEMNVRLFDDRGRDVTAEGRGQPGCRGPLQSSGYDGDEEAQRSLYTEDGWMLVGDIVEIDGDGYLRVIGRADDFIIRGGKNISGPGVEQAVATHPAIALAAAVAMPDATYGERVCVFVELHKGESLTLEELVAHLEETGASIETFPEHLVVSESLPRASGGKVAKQRLREEIRDRVASRETPSVGKPK